MRKIYLALIMFGLFGTITAQSPNTIVNISPSSNLGSSASVGKDTRNNHQVSSMADTKYSFMGTCFFKNDGFTVTNWQEGEDIDLVYDGTIGSKSYYKRNRLEFLQNGLFKIRKNHDWTEAYGFDVLDIQGPDNFGWLDVYYNVKVLVRKIYDVTFIVDTVSNTYTLIFADSPPIKTKAIINKASTAPVVDGTIDAVWSTANSYNVDQKFMSNAPTLGASGTTTWKGLWTDNGIYILVQVNDNVFFPAYLGAIPGNVWEYDKVELYFDVNQILADGKGPGSPGDTWWGHYQFAPDFTAGNLHGTLETLYDGLTKYSFQVSNPGYVAEIYIPFTRLLDKTSTQVAKTAIMGFDVTINDRDIEANPKQCAVWTNFGRVDGSWNNMDDCGTIMLVGSGANVLVSSISVNSAGNATTITHEAGTLQMSAAVLPADATNKNITWTVTNGTGKASISAGGLLTAKEDGTVTVTATANDGSGITGSKVITISNQYISFADGSIIKDGGFETDGPVQTNPTFPYVWTLWSGNGGTASVINGVCNIVPAAVAEIYFLQVSQWGWVAYNDSSYNLSFTAWSDVTRTIEVDLEDNNNNYNRFGASTDPEAIANRSDWIVPLTTTPTVYTFHVTMDQIKVTTNFSLMIMASNALGTVYIDNISLVSVGYKPLGNGPPLPGTAAADATICSGTTASLTLDAYSGSINWQKSSDGSTGWTFVTDGTGATTASYTTGNLSATTYFRAAVKKPDYTPVYSNVIKITVNPLPSNAGTISGLSTICSGQNKSVLYSVPVISNAVSYVWTLPSGVTGISTSRNITAKYGASAVSGNITVKGHNTCGDGVASSLAVSLSNPFAGEKICLVTLDLETGKNMVVWERTHNVGIVSYNVYREKVDQAGIYEVIGNVNFNDIPIFVDQTSNPKNRQYLYKISAIDTCGNESALSKYHKTVFLQYAGTTSGVNLAWEKYEVEDGTPDISGYAIFKGSDSTKLSIFTTVSTSVKVYTDNDASALTNKTYYRIGGVLKNACNPAELPGKKTSSGPYVHSLSNLEDNRLQGTGIGNYAGNAFDLTISPNPFTDMASIYYSLQKPSKIRVEVYNVVGEKVAVLIDESQASGSHTIDMKAADLNFTNGLYYIRFAADDMVLIRKTVLSR